MFSLRYRENRKYRSESVGFLDDFLEYGSGAYTCAFLQSQKYDKTRSKRTSASIFVDSCHCFWILADLGGFRMVIEGCFFGILLSVATYLERGNDRRIMKLTHVGEPSNDSHVACQILTSNMRVSKISRHSTSGHPT